MEGGGGMAPPSYEETIAQRKHRAVDAGLGSAVGPGSTAGHGLISSEPAQLNHSQMPVLSAIQKRNNQQSLGVVAALAASPSRLPPLSVFTPTTQRRRRRRVVPSPAEAVVQVLEEELRGKGGR
jgi:hypothetical protein